MCNSSLLHNVDNQYKKAVVLHDGLMENSLYCFLGDRLMENSFYWLLDDDDNNASSMVLGTVLACTCHWCISITCFSSFCVMDN